MLIKGNKLPSNHYKNSALYTLIKLSETEGSSMLDIIIKDYGLEFQLYSKNQFRGSNSCLSNFSLKYSAYKSFCFQLYLGCS